MAARRRKRVSNLEAAVPLLADRNATWEHPGYIRIPVGRNGSFSINIGTANGVIGYDVTDSEGRVYPNQMRSTLPLNATADQIATYAGRVWHAHDAFGGHGWMVLPGDGFRGVSSLTYGTLPSRETFLEHFSAREDAHDRYQMQLNRADANLVNRDLHVAGKHAAYIDSTPGHLGIAFDSEGLYKLLKVLVKRGHEHALDFTSAVLSTLGFEWV